MKNSLMRPSFFLYFEKSGINEANDLAVSQLRAGPRLYSSYKLYPCARPAHVGYCGPGAEFKFSKIVEVRWSC